MAFVELAWIPLALIGAFIGAGQGLVNQWFKFNGWHIVFWSRVLVMLFSATGFLFYPWPITPIFYIAVALTSILVFYADRTGYQLIGEIDAGAISRLSPLIAVFSFIFWAVWSPATLLFYINHPLIGIGLTLSLLMVVYFAMHLRANCPVSRQALRRYIPAMVCYGLVDILNKTAMDAVDLESGIVSYIFFQSVGIVLLGLLSMGWQRSTATFGQPWRNKQLAVASLMIAGFWLGAMIFRQAAIKLSESPAYPTTLGLSSPIWIILIYALIGYREKARVKEGLMMLAALAIFTFFAALQ